MNMANGNGEAGAIVEAVTTAAAISNELRLAVGEEKKVADLEVPFKIGLDGELCAVMTETLVKYLLYLRGQIPCVYDEFQALVRKQQAEETAALVAGTRKRKLVGGSAKKARKLVELADNTLSTGLFQMFQRRVHTVAVVFGTTVLSPREIWRIDFRDGGSVQATGTDAINAPTLPLGVQDNADATIPRKRVMRLCVQKLIRTVLSYATTRHFSSPLGVTSMHLLVLADKSEIPLQGFIPKQQLRLRDPKPTKTGKRIHTIEIQHGGLPGRRLDAQDQTPNDVVGELLWYQSVRPLHGVSRLS